MTQNPSSARALPEPPVSLRAELRSLQDLSARQSTEIATMQVSHAAKLAAIQAEFTRHDEELSKVQAESVKEGPAGKE